MHRLIPIAVTLWLLVVANAAQAGTLTVQFDVTSSTIDILGGGIIIPPEGSITAGSLSLSVPAADVQSPEPGSASLDSLMLDVAIDGDILGNSIAGSVASSQTGTAAGTLLPGLSVLNFPGPLVLDMNGSIDCSGLNCSSIGSFPISVMDSYDLPVLGSLLVAGLATPGASTLNATLPVTIAGFSAELALVGGEIRRSFVPEPTAAALLGMGLVALAGLRGRLERTWR